MFYDQVRMRPHLANMFISNLITHFPVFNIENNNTIENDEPPARKMLLHNNLPLSYQSLIIDTSISDLSTCINKVEEIKGYSQDFYSNVGNSNEHKNKKQKKIFLKTKKNKRSEEQIKNAILKSNCAQKIQKKNTNK